MSDFQGRHFAWKMSVALLTLSTFLMFGIALFSPNQITSAQTNIVNFSIGPGYVDAAQHQTVRSKNDRIYIFAAQAQYSKVLVGHWTTAAGLPTSSSNFNGSITVTEADNIISVDTAYDGDTTIHVLLITQGGKIKDYPFDTATDTFKTPIVLATDGGTVAGDYMGSGGISGMVDLNKQLQVSHWTSSNHIVHRAYSYNASTNVLTATGTATQVDTGGHSNHPELAVSPVDNSVTVSWVSEVNAPTGNILARTRSASGIWGAVESVSTSDAWTSLNAGVNIDQGPSLVINSDGAKFITYIQDYDSTGTYGGIHVASFNGTTWADSPVAIGGNDPDLVINGTTYTHTPVLAVNNANQLYLFGHGPMQTHVNNNMYAMRQNTNGTWAVPSLLASGDSFDSSVSMKWSVVGDYRPDLYEFAFFLAPASQYSSSVLYYGRLQDSGIASTPTASPAVPNRNYFTTSTPQLTWNRVSWARGYQIEVAITNGFGTTVVFTSTVSAGTLSTVTSTLGNGSYFWHVRAMQADGNWGGWSVAETFEVNAP